MTPASPLSRLEKLAIKYEQEQWTFIEFEGWQGNPSETFIAGGKAMLQILSEPGEACGPRVFVHEAYLKIGIGNGIEAWKIKPPFDDRKEMVEYCDLRELTQARAALEGTKKQADYLQMRCSANEDTEIPALQKQLASSEARVRKLLEAVESCIEGFEGSVLNFWESPLGKKLTELLESEVQR